MNLQPIQPSVGVKLRDGEQVYAEFTANRIAIIDGETNKSSSESRALMGGAVGTGFGLGGGRVRSASTSKITETKEIQIVDQGTLLLTNKRFVFVGGELTHRDYSDVDAINFAELSKDEQKSFSTLLKNSGTFKDNLVKRAGSTALVIHRSGNNVGEQYLIGGINSREITEKYNAISLAFDTPKAGVRVQKHINRWYVLVTLLVIFFPPVGIPMMFRLDKPSKNVKVAIAIIWGIVWLISAIHALTNPDTAGLHSTH